VLDFPLAQEQEHLEQNLPIMGESWCVLAFPLAQAKAHLEHHLTVEKS
jgi:hypothetical protein